MEDKVLKNKNLMNGVELSSEKLDDAFFDAYDLMSRCLLQSIFLVLGDTGRALDEKRIITGDGVYIGIPKRYLTKEVKSTLRTFHPESEITEQGMTYTHFGVPVNIKFINNNYKFFQHPESVFYAAENFQIPNPFNKYFRARMIVR